MVHKHHSPLLGAHQYESEQVFCQLQSLVDTVNQAGGTYHCLYLGHNLLIRGCYDMTKYLHHYQLPLSLHGKTVLDIGTASGYFALECARRGGRVTAIDLWNSSLLSQLLALINLDIQYIQADIRDLDATFGSFDLVICGSLLQHLPDPYQGICRIQTLCRERAIIATGCPYTSWLEPRAFCVFRGQRAKEGAYWNYWDINAAALRKMLMTAGFRQIAYQDHFTLRSERGWPKYTDPHVVMCGIV